MKVRWKALLIMLVILGWTPAGQAEIVRKEVDEHVTATAEYRAGSPENPAILVLHGFLQTRDFSTVRRLADSLYDWNYTVLSPTLSLGIDTRARSLPCEAIQTHGMQDAVNELAMWIEWLVAQGHDEVILVGHSSGASQILVYLNGQPHPAVKQAILVSLVAFGPGESSNETEEHAQSARAAVAAGEKGLKEYGLSFCTVYPTPPELFLSYYDWSMPRLAAALDGTEVPVSVVVGTEDRRMTPEWVAMITASSANVVIVEGASHFFDDTAEFDLLDVFQELLGP